MIRKKTIVDLLDKQHSWAHHCIALAQSKPGVLLTPGKKVKLAAQKGFLWAKTDFSGSKRKLLGVAQHNLNQLNLSNTSDNRVVFWTAVRSFAFVQDKRESIAEILEESQGEDLKYTIARRILSRLPAAGILR